MSIDSFDAVFYTCIFLLPGFIIKNIRNLLVPPERHVDSKYFLSCFLYSIINCAFLSWVYKLIFSTIDRESIIHWVLLLIVTIIGAIIVAFAIGIIIQQGYLAKFLNKTPINFINPIPTAWDYVFSKQKHSRIIVYLKNGKTVYGRLGSNSCVSSDFEERDIYIEKTYDLDLNKKWIENIENDGILIPKEAIEVIEFQKTEKEGNSDVQKITQEK